MPDKLTDADENDVDEADYADCYMGVYGGTCFKEGQWRHSYGPGCSKYVPPDTSDLSPPSAADRFMSTVFAAAVVLLLVGFLYIVATSMSTNDAPPVDSVIDAERYEY